MPGKGQREISAYQAGQWTKEERMECRGRNEKGRNDIPQQWTKHDSGIECRGMDEVRSAYQAGQWTKEGGMVFRNNGQSESGIECRGMDEVRSAYQAGEWTK
jgi:hypothetical protein